MKKKINLITAILLTGTALSISSCLKDNSHYIDFAGSIPTVELPLSAPSDASPSAPFNAASFPIQSTPTAFSIIVNLASPKTLSTAVTVTLALDPTDLAAYNAANSTSYIILPPADYTVPSWTITIPPGGREVPFKINLITSAIDPSQAYVLPIKIVSSSVTVNQFNYVLFNIGVQNQYDGDYTVTGKMVDVINPNLTGDYPEAIQLITQSANSDAFYDPNIGYGHAILNAGSASYYGDFAPVFTFSGNTVTAVTNIYGQPAADGRSAILSPSGINTISGTPGTVGSVISVTYIMQQTGDGNRTTFTEQLTYTGPR
jgi:hypothetical protein